MSYIFSTDWEFPLQLNRFVLSNSREHYITMWINLFLFNDIIVLIIVIPKRGREVPRIS